MSSTSVAVEQKSIHKQQVIKDRTTVISGRKPPKKRRYVWLRTKIYNQVMETVKAILLVIAFLSVYMLSGMHDWWMHFVNKLL